MSHPNTQPTHRIQWATVFSTHANFQPIIIDVRGVLTCQWLAQGPMPLPYKLCT